MILNKKAKNKNFFKIIKKVFSKFIYFIGLATCLITIILIGYYYSSGMHERFKPIPLIKKVDESNFHIHSYKIEDILTSKPEDYFYICDHC